LIYFLERNGFYPRQQDIEAILRRVDHSGDQSIGYDEFCDLVQIKDKSTTADSPEKRSSGKKEESKFSSPKKSSPTKQPESAVKSSPQKAVVADELRITKRESDSKRA